MTLDLLGDKWTLLVVRDLLFLDKRKFGELAASPEGIPTNILTDRLRRLEECGVLVKVPYLSRPRRFEYHLTERGLDLLPVLRAMIQWGHRHLPGTGSPPPGALEKIGGAHEQAAVAPSPPPLSQLPPRPRRERGDKKKEGGRWDRGTGVKSGPCLP